MKIFYSIASVAAGGTGTFTIPNHKERLLKAIGMRSSESSVLFNAVVYRSNLENPIVILSGYHPVETNIEREICKDLTISVYNGTAGAVTYTGYIELSDTLKNLYTVQ